MAFRSTGAPWQSIKLEGPNPAGVARLILNRPDVYNALDDDLFRELPLALQELDDNQSVRVIIVSAAGKHFCAGINLGTLGAKPALKGSDGETGRRELGKQREFFRRHVKVMQSAFTAFESCRKPVVAAIHGACIGGGIDLITACDLRYSTDDAKFSVKEVDVAITADLGTLQRLPLIVGYSKAMELALTAKNIDGNEAHRLGLVHGVYSSKEDLERGSSEIATQLAEKSPLAIMGTKAVLLKSRDTSVAEGLDYVATWNAALLWDDEIKETMTAKAEKRKPVFAKL